MAETNQLIVGIDLGYPRAMVSIYHESMKEPETISTSSGEEIYQIPTCIFRANGGAFYYGAEAQKREYSEDGEFYDHLLENAIQEQDCDIYRPLLAQFVARLLQFRSRYGWEKLEYFVTLTVPVITPEVVATLDYIRDMLGLDAYHCKYMDYGESFFNHTFFQEESVWLHDVALYDFTDNAILFYLLRRSGENYNHQVYIEHEEWVVPESVMRDPGKKDTFFTGILKETLAKRIVSGIYFVGDGFDGKWLKNSLTVLGSNKRVFLGNNLYARGGSYAWLPNPKNLFYDCSYKMQGSAGLQMQRGGSVSELPLVGMGENWFEQNRTYYFLYGGEPEIQVRVLNKNLKQPVIRKFVLDDLPDRDPKTIRLRMEVQTVSGREFRLYFRDDGFGELFEPSGREWGFPIRF